MKTIITAFVLWAAAVVISIIDEINLDRLIWLFGFALIGFSAFSIGWITSEVLKQKNEREE